MYLNYMKCGQSFFIGMASVQVIDYIVFVKMSFTNIFIALPFGTKQSHSRLQNKKFNINLDLSKQDSQKPQQNKEMKEK